MEVTIDINELKSGNHKAYELLFREFYAPLCRYANSILRDLPESEDLVQKTFYKLWDQHESLDIHTSIKSYLYRIVHNNCMNKIKQQQLHSEHHRHYAYEKEELTDSTETMLLTIELENKIKSVIESLPPRCREIFMMSRNEQLSYAEIAKKLTISNNTVEVQMVKALRILRSGLKDYLITIILTAGFSFSAVYCKLTHLVTHSSTYLF